MRRKITFMAKYKAGAWRLTEDSHPRLRHLNPGFVVHSAEIQATGWMRMEDGQELEFVDMRVFVKPGVIKN